MADTAIAITAGTGTNVDTRTEATNGNHRQVVVLGDPSTNAGVAPVDGTSGLKVNLGVDNDIVITPSNLSGGEYETVAASQTAQVLGGSGALGDYLHGILVVPATLSPGNIIILDDATSITVFTGGASSITELRPFFIPLGMVSVSGAWKVTTGANVSCIAIGNFSA